MTKKVESEHVQDAFKKHGDVLTEQEKVVLMRFYGLGSEVRHTLAEIGEEYQLTRERIRQIKAGALKKIKIKSIKT